MRSRWSGRRKLTIELKPTRKVVDHIRKSSDAAIVAFKAEHGIPKKDLVARGKAMLKAKRADLVVANDLRDVKGERTSVLIIQHKGKEKAAKGTKDEVAARIVSEAARLLR